MPRSHYGVIVSKEYYEPGSELDAQVARVVFGDNVQPVEKSWTHEDWAESDHPTHLGGYGILPGPRADVAWAIPRFSESYEDMELVIDKLVADRWYMHMARSHLGDCPWWCSMFQSSEPSEQGETDDEEYSAIGLTLPHAVALAALYAYKGRAG